MVLVPKERRRPPQVCTDFKNVLKKENKGKSKLEKTLKIKQTLPDGQI
jgi:hypothetical protein